MKIALVDPFYEESHKIWAEGLKDHSAHDIDIYSGSAHNWKWKMTGGALEMARQINQSSKRYGLFLVTDMLHLPLFKSMLALEYHNVPFALYFHENQVTYPWSPTDQDVVHNRDRHYGFINFCSAFIAQKVFFNSKYHMDSFLNELPVFLKPFPERSLIPKVEEIAVKSTVLPLGLNLPSCGPSQTEHPIFIWNHRWEYDKNPELFFNSLIALKDLGIEFQLIVTGKSYKKVPEIFEIAKERLANEIIHYGYANSRDAYLRLLGMANVIFVTSNQDFFGISTVEAIATGCYPILPNRLSYGEHIKDSLRERMLYEGNDCMPLLLEVVKEKRFLDSIEASDFVQRYTWSNVVGLYNSNLDNGGI